MGETVIGLDIGTSSIKTVTYSLEKRTILSKRAEIPAEISDGETINPEAIIKLVINLLSKTVKDSKDKITTISLSTLFPSLLALDCKGRPLTKILTWMDNTASPIVTDFKQNTDKSLEIYHKTGCVIHESYPLWKILWLKKTHPNIFSKTKKFISLSEYITYKLTGKFIVSNSIASTTSMFNTKSLDWDESILDLAGINQQKLSQHYSPFHQEMIQKSIASKIGLKNEASLILGAGDGLLCHVGTGCTKPGIMSSTLGTSGALRFSSQTPLIKNDKLWCYNLDDKTWILGSAINAGWSTLKHLKDSIKNFKFSDSQLKQQPKGPLFLPFFDGERGPGYNQNMKAAFIMLNTKHNMKTLYHSTIEGILFNLYSCYEIITKQLGKPSQIRASGGYTASDNMLQMQTNIFNKKITITDVKEASAVGAAIIALKAINEVSNIADIESGIEKTFYPDKEKNELYMERYELYKKAYFTLSKT